MKSVVRLGPSETNPWPLLITTTTKPKNGGTTPLVGTFRIEEMPWSDPIGAALRDAQQTELDIRYLGSEAKEPGIKPAGDNIALFLIAYPVPIIDSTSTTTVTEEESTPIACGSLRDLGDGYMEARSRTPSSDQQSFSRSIITQIKRMYAIQSVRGTGASLSVLLALEHYARAIGLKALRLETGNRQQEAMKFYERYGYVSIPRFGHYADVPWSHCYEKVLV